MDLLLKLSLLLLISIIVPNGSRCLNGFKFSLPCLLGVSSPNLSAAKACANSWNVIAINIPGIVSTKLRSAPSCENNVINELNSIKAIIKNIILLSIYINQFPLQINLSNNILYQNLVFRNFTK